MGPEVYGAHRNLRLRPKYGCRQIDASYRSSGDHRYRPELIQRHFPQRFEELPPAIFLQHYVEERSPQGRLGRKATWDRLTFHPWTPRLIWLSGQERISFGDPHWERLPKHEVEALLGRDEVQALQPHVPIANDQP